MHCDLSRLPFTAGHQPVTHLLSLLQQTLVRTNSIRHKNYSLQINDAGSLKVKLSAWKETNRITTSVWDRTGPELHFKVKINW